MGSAAQVVFGIVALASIHWLLLVISLVIALVMIFVPRLFSKRLGTVGTACAASQADSVSKIKDLLAGYDVLRFFGKDERFTSGVDAASDSMEQAKYKLTINKDGSYSFGKTTAAVDTETLKDTASAVVWPMSAPSAKWPLSSCWVS